VKLLADLAPSQFHATIGEQRIKLAMARIDELSQKLKPADSCSTKQR
jgi:hypothetical protein